jgi:hypothetical protein
MYFTTFNHYDDNDIIYDEDHNIIYNNEQCLICWDKYTPNNNIYKMQSLLSSSIYYTPCTCNGYFHNTCLLKWIYKTNSCPICRITFEFNVDDQNLPLTFNAFKLIKFFLTCVLIRILYDIMFGIQYAVEKKIQNEQYSSL